MSRTTRPRSLTKLLFFPYTSLDNILGRTAISFPFTSILLTVTKSPVSYIKGPKQTLHIMKNSGTQEFTSLFFNIRTTHLPHVKTTGSYPAYEKKTKCSPRYYAGSLSRPTVWIHLQGCTTRAYIFPIFKQFATLGISPHFYIRNRKNKEKNIFIFFPDC